MHNDHIEQVPRKTVTSKQANKKKITFLSASTVFSISSDFPSLVQRILEDVLYPSHYASDIAFFIALPVLRPLGVLVNICLHIPVVAAEVPPEPGLDVVDLVVTNALDAPEEVVTITGTDSACLLGGYRRNGGVSGLLVAGLAVALIGRGGGCGGLFVVVATAAGVFGGGGGPGRARV